MSTFTVVRFPNGSWSSGGPVSSPDYERCEVYVVPAQPEAAARKQAQAARRKLTKSGADMPSQQAPYIHPSCMD